MFNHTLHITIMNNTFQIIVISFTFAAIVAAAIISLLLFADDIIIIAVLAFTCGMLMVHCVSHERRMAKLRSESLARRSARFHAKKSKDINPV